MIEAAQSALLTNDVYLRAYQMPNMSAKRRQSPLSGLWRAVDEQVDAR